MWTKRVCISTCSCPGGYDQGPALRALAESLAASPSNDQKLRDFFAQATTDARSLPQCTRTAFSFVIGSYLTSLARNPSVEFQLDTFYQYALCYMALSQLRDSGSCQAMLSLGQALGGYMSAISQNPNFIETVAEDLANALAATNVTDFLGLPEFSPPLMSYNWINPTQIRITGYTSKTALVELMINDVEVPVTPPDFSSTGGPQTVYYTISAGQCVTDGDIYTVRLKSQCHSPPAARTYTWGGVSGNIGLITTTNFVYTTSSFFFSGGYPPVNVSVTTVNGTPVTISPTQISSNGATVITFGTPRTSGEQLLFIMQTCDTGTFLEFTIP